MKTCCLIPKSPNPSHHSCPDLVPVISTIGVDPEIATTTTRLRTSLHYVHVHVRKVVCDNTVLSGVCYILCCINMLYICRFPITIRFQVLQFIAAQILIYKHITTQYINNENN